MHRHYYSKQYTTLCTQINNKPTMSMYTLATRLATCKHRNPTIPPWSLASHGARATKADHCNAILLTVVMAINCVLIASLCCLCGHRSKKQNITIIEKFLQHKTNSPSSISLVRFSLATPAIFPNYYLLIDTSTEASANPQTLAAGKLKS